MDKNQKIIATTLWGVLVLTMVGVVVGQFWLPRGARGEDLPVFFPAAGFALTDQDGKPLTDQGLRGHPYVASFIFTTCSGTCPVMSTKMARLQKQTPADVRLISFSVDPGHDTPQVLKQYGQRYGADSSRWSFLTGTQKQMYDTAYAMKVAAKPADGADPILHSDKFLLVDAGGNVRGIYDSKDDASIQKLVIDATRLASERARSK